MRPTIACISYLYSMYAGDTQQLSVMPFRYKVTKIIDGLTVAKDVLCCILSEFML